MKKILKPVFILLTICMIAGLLPWMRHGHCQGSVSDNKLTSIGAYAFYGCGSADHP